MCDNILYDDAINSYPSVAKEPVESDRELRDGTSLLGNNAKFELEPRLNAERELYKKCDELLDRLISKYNDLTFLKDKNDRKDIDEILELNAEIQKLEKELRFYNSEIIRDALDIMEFGDPFNFIMDQFSKLHVGDTAIGKVLLLSIMNTCILNTEGLQPKLSGESGKGKTHCAKSMFHLIRDTPYKMEGSLSAKSLFYKKDMVDGTIMFSDDIKMSEELESTLKIAMSNFQQNTIHNTLIKQEYIQTSLPKRLCWWLTSVESNFSNELVNRLYDQNVDESEDMDKKVYDDIFERAASGALAFPEAEEIVICRTIIHIIKRQLFNVTVPYATKFHWNIKGDRRNPSRFVALIMGYAVINYLQRESPVVTL